MYSKIDSKKLILRDHLATNRTKLANERTFLAYARTSLTLIAAGVSIAKFLGANKFYYFIGWILCVLGIVVFIWGIISFRKISLILRKIKLGD